MAFQSDVSGRDRLGKLTRNIFRVVNEQLDLFSIHDKFEMILRIAGCIYASRIPNERPAVPYLGDDSPLLLCKYASEFEVAFILIVEYNLSAKVFVGCAGRGNDGRGHCEFIGG